MRPFSTRSMAETVTGRSYVCAWPATQHFIHINFQTLYVTPVTNHPLLTTGTFIEPHTLALSWNCIQINQLQSTSHKSEHNRHSHSKHSKHLMIHALMQSLPSAFPSYRTSMWINMNRCRIYHAFIKLPLGDADKWGKLTMHHTVSNLIPSTQNPINKSTRSFTETVVWDLRFVRWWQDLSSWMQRSVV